MANLVDFRPFLSPKWGWWKQFQHKNIMKANYWEIFQNLSKNAETGCSIFVDWWFCGQISSYQLWLYGRFHAWHSICIIISTQLQLPPSMLEVDASVSTSLTQIITQSKLTRMKKWKFVFRINSTIFIAVTQHWYKAYCLSV